MSHSANSTAVLFSPICISGMEIEPTPASIVSLARSISELASNVGPNREDCLEIFNRMRRLIPQMERLNPQKDYKIICKRMIKTLLDDYRMFLTNVQECIRANSVEDMAATNKQEFDRLNIRLDKIFIELDLSGTAKLDAIAELLRRQQCTCESFERVYYEAPPSDAFRNEPTVLTAGSFGDTRRMINRADKSFYTVKRIQLTLTRQMGVTDEVLTVECAKLLRLSHPTIARHFILFPSAEGPCLHLVMELVDGGITLASKIKRTPPLPEAQIVEWVRQMASALSYMHGEGVLHRDLRPENLQLAGGKDRIVITNFCLACESAGGADLTEYSSPEKLGGTDQKDGGDDVWSVGCILTELLTRTRLADRPLHNPDDPRRAALFSQATARSPWIAAKVLPWLLHVDPKRRCSSFEFDNLVQQCKAPLLWSLDAAVRDRDEHAQQQALERLVALTAESFDSVTLATADTVFTLLKLLEEGSDRVKEQTVRLLQALVATPKVHKLIEDSALVLPLVSLVAVLETGSLSIQKAIVEVLRTAAAFATTSAMQDAVPRLMQIVHSETTCPITSKESAMHALVTFCTVNENIREFVIAAGVIPRCVQLLTEGTEEEKEDAIALLGLLSVASSSKDISMYAAPAKAINALVLQLRAGVDDDVKELAARALSNLTMCAGNLKALEEARAVPLLVELLRRGEEEGKRWAARTLANMAVDAECRKSIAAAKAIPPLLNMLREEMDDSGEHAAAALAHLAQDTADSRNLIVLFGGIAPLVEMLVEGTEEGKAWAALALANLAVGVDNCNLVVQLGAIPQLVKLLEEGTEHAKEQAAGTLRSLTISPANAPANVQIIAETEGSGTALVQLLTVGTERAKEHSAELIGQFAKCGTIRKSTAVGALPPLVALLTSEMHSTTKKAAVATLCLLARGEGFALAVAESGAIPPLVQLLRESAVDVLKEALNALFTISTGTGKCKEMAEAGILPLVMNLLKSEIVDEEIQRKAADMLFLIAILTGQEYINEITATGAIPVLVQLLGVEDERTKWVTAKLLAFFSSKVEYAAAIAAAGALPPLILLLRTGTDMLKEQAAHTLAFLAAHKTNKLLIVQAGALPPLMKLLREGTEKTKLNALRALWTLAVDVQNKIAIAKAGAIPLMVQLLGQDTTRVGELAAATLSNLALEATNRARIVAAEAIPLLLVMKRKGSLGEKERAIRALKNLAADQEIKERIAAAAAATLNINHLTEPDSVDGF